MATIRQIEANRRNAQASTGPRTESGKAVSRMNALKSGIDAQSLVITGEEPSDLTALTAEYYDRFQPQFPEERCLVDSLVSADWLLRRLRKAEAQLWDEEMDAAERYSPENPLGYVASARADNFSRLQRRLDSTDRSYHRSLDKLRKLQSSRPAPQPIELSEGTNPISPISEAPSPAAPAPPAPIPVAIAPSRIQSKATPSPQPPMPWVRIKDKSV